ncbi:tol-pal system YbgF family protein [Planctomycetota bacterium]
MTREYLKQKNNDRHKNQTIFMLLSCITLLPVLLLASITGLAFAGSETDVDQIAVETESDIETIDNSGSLIRDLRKEDISVLDNNNSSSVDYELQQLIEQIQSVELRAPEQISQSMGDSEAIILAELNDVSSDGDVLEIIEQEESDSELPYVPVALETLELLARIAESPDQVDNPFELGEILFLSRNLKQAAVFYREALERIGPDEPDSASERAWILLQTGNCLRNDDMPLAADNYRQLITEYPDSIWSEYAETQVKVIDWFVSDEPYKIIDENKNEE